MEIVGRLTQHATLRTVKKYDPKVVSFTIAVNDYFKPKDAEQGIKVTTYIDCRYWVNPGIAKYLSQGTLVEVHGRICIYATAYKDKNGEAKASINCHLNTIKIHKQITLTKQGSEPTFEAKTADLPF